MWPILRLCISVTKWLINYLTYKSKNCWHCVNAHFHNGAGSVSLPLLPINAANTSCMNVCNQLLLWGCFSYKYKYLCMALDIFLIPFNNIISFLGKVLFLSLVFSTINNPWYYGLLSYPLPRHTIDTLRPLSFHWALTSQFPLSESNSFLQTSLILLC